MVGGNELISLKSLKTNIWSKNISKGIKPEISFDKYNDTFTIIFSPCNERILVYYIDYFVSVLYRHSDKEIIGIQIDTFFKSFFPKYATENKGWNLRDSGVEVSGDDIVINCKMKNNMVVEIISSITSDIVKKEGIPLEPIYA